MKFTRKTAKFLFKMGALAYLISGSFDLLITHHISGEWQFSALLLHQFFVVMVLVTMVLKEWLPLSDEEIQEKYVEAGKSVGDALNQIYLTPHDDFIKEMMENWVYWEKEYLRRGYKSLPVDNFIRYDRCGEPLEGLNVKRQIDEEPIFHAEIAKKDFHPVKRSLFIK